MEHQSKIQQKKFDLFIDALLSEKTNTSIDSNATIFSDSVFSTIEHDYNENNYDGNNHNENNFNENIINDELLSNNNTDLLRNTLNYKLKCEKNVDFVAKNNTKLKRSKSFNSYFSHSIDEDTKSLIDYASNIGFKTHNKPKCQCSYKYNKLNAKIENISAILNSMANLLMKINDTLDNKSSSFYEI